MQRLGERLRCKETLIGRDRAEYPVGVAKAGAIRGHRDIPFLHLALHGRRGPAAFEKDVIGDELEGIIQCGETLLKGAGNLAKTKECDFHGVIQI